MIPSRMVSPALAYPAMMAETNGVNLNMVFNMAVSLVISDDAPEITGATQGAQSTRYPLDIPKLTNAAANEIARC
ncbi:hypothetical protein D3C72_2242070 [compost metagenome]